jgi:four helix bundle protein
MRSAFRDLAAYQRAIDVADYLHERVASWPSDERRSIGRQLLRSTDSIAANIAEASGRWHRADQRRLLIIARGSLLETEHWITTAERRGLLEPNTSDRLTEIARPLSGLIRRTG